MGIGPGIEGGFAPSRVLLAVGLVLVGGTALRAAIALGDPRLRWPAAISAGLVMAALASPGGLHPALSPWIERPSTLEPQAEVWVMDANGRRQTRLIEPDEGTGLGNPVWSPDGSRIAYVRFSGLGAGSPTREADIWVADADGGNARVLVGDPGWQWFPRWSPDGAWIAYTQEASGGPWMNSGPVGPVPGQGPQGPDFAATGEAARPEADLWRHPVRRRRPCRAADRRAGRRPIRDLVAGRPAARVRLDPRRPHAAVRDQRRWLGPGPHRGIERRGLGRVVVPRWTQRRIHLRSQRRCPGLGRRS